MGDEQTTVEKKWTKKKVVKTLMLFTISVGLIVAACFYAYFVQYYSEHLYEGTTINGNDYSNLTEAEAETLLQKELDQWSITVYEREGVEETIDAEDISMTYVDDGSLHDLYLTQQPLFWVARIFNQHEVELPSAFSYDEELLKEVFENFRHVKEFTPMKNAELVENEDGTYSIDPEVTGTEMDQEAAYEALEEAVTAQKSELDLEEFYLSPEVYADDEDLVDEMEEKNTIFYLTRAVILVQFGDEQFTIDEELLTEWLTEDPETRYRIDEEKLRAFVQNLYDTYNVGHEGQLFKTKNGRVLTLSTFEVPGWNIDVDKSCERYLKAIQEGYQGVLGPVMTRLDDEGNVQTDTYVEISIDEQTMWLIVDGEVQLETPVVTGGADVGNASSVSTEALIAEFNSRSTPSNGIWTIKKKQSPHFMKGPMLANGSYEYTLQVTYWLPFNNLVGIHDNYQRVEYGGKIYQTSGSHGCINTPYEAVEEIFNTVEVGTMVVVYGADTGEELFASSEDEHAEGENENSENAEENREEDDSEKADGETGAGQGTDSSEAETP